ALHGQIQRRQARAPSSVRSDVPRAVDVICARCLDPDPALRYATARALADDIRRLRSGEPLVARPISRLALIARGLARRKGTAALLAAASGLLLWAAWAGLSQRGRFDQISYAHRVQSAYGALAPRVDPVLARAEESRDAATVEEKTAILADLERRLAGGADDTGVGEAYRAWTMFLLDVEGATAALEEARRRHPENPFIPLVAARMHLRRYAESVSWPAASGVALYATAEPFQSLSPIETPEMRENLERAHAAVLAAIQSSVWHELPALGWIIDLLDGVERFAAGDMRGAVAKLPRPGDRADLEIDGALLLALAYCRLGDLDAAAHAAAELARNRPRLLPAALILSECHAHRGYRRMAQHQDALGDFLEARAALSRLQHRPELQQTIADLEVSIASARQQRGEDPRPELQSALAAYDRLLAARPGNYRLRFNRGMALVSLADAGGAPRDPGARPEADARAALMDEALAEVERAYAESAEDELIGSGLAQAHVGRLLAERAAGVLEDEAFDPAFRALDQVERHGREKADLHYARASLHLVRADNARARRRAAAADLERAAELAARAAAMSPLFLEARQLASTATLLLALEKPVPAEEILAAAAVSREHRLGGVPNAPAPPPWPRQRSAPGRTRRARRRKSPPPGRAWRWPAPPSPTSAETRSCMRGNAAPWAFRRRTRRSPWPRTGPLATPPVPASRPRAATPRPRSPASAGRAASPTPEGSAGAWPRLSTPRPGSSCARSILERDGTRPPCS
ncbi:MAG: hypothetical protein HY812_00430, partial [Planctomycetes bacterium]|nr:hypothetical protein [Planctomycetota bacterium]